MKEQNILNDSICYGRNVCAAKPRFTGYDHLAIAIVNQAAIDYRRELKISMKLNRKTPEALKLERFFKSEYCDLLSRGKGEYILEQLQKEVVSGVKRKRNTLFFCKSERAKNIKRSVNNA